MKVKRALRMLLCLCLLMGIMTGCSNNDQKVTCGDNRSILYNAGNGKATFSNVRVWNYQTGKKTTISAKLEVIMNGNEATFMYKGVSYSVPIRTADNKSWIKVCYDTDSKGNYKYDTYKKK